MPLSLRNQHESVIGAAMSTERDPRLLSAEELATIRTLSAGEARTDAQYIVIRTLQHIDAQAEQIARLAIPLVQLARAAVAYDEAIKECANDPDRMASYCTAEGEDLDTLYFDVIGEAHRVLGLPDLPVEDEGEK
jgi:hypothetical protein